MRLILYSFATFLPAILLVIGAFTGGWILWAAPVTIGLMWIVMDQMPDPTDGRELPVGDGLLVILGFLQLTHMVLGVWAMTFNLHGFDWIMGMIGFGLFFGQVGNPAAHELIHRSDRFMTRLGTVVYIGFLFGHHVSAHRLVHHPHVATPQDPVSATKGTNFWIYLPVAWWGSFMSGYKAEKALRQRGTVKKRNPYVYYVGGELILIAICFALCGPWGLFIYVMLCAHTQAQMLVADYVQHYGLRRRRLPNGRYEAAGPWHAWNSKGWYSSAVTLNAPRHSDHHAHPARPYPQLTLPEGSAMLPAPLPAMAMLAMLPPFWKRVMDPRLAALLDEQETAPRVSPDAMPVH
ncbi:alkane 1-monooxygenase [Rhodobacter sp. NTK016B]|uniref:alkane 1-monooxygenase n=1 Tax=Rhodobacter sp. NTK016B TaxID=2759676 RepID=UPI001A8D48E4|nr:alkane 1-monooxygenase [Rhodobacter sp. NTK016B]MBN8290809.1 alkane 1-monooxygenase [Rhodobacter sp. NTK016B]